MPGINQLKKFSNDVTALGNETQIRQQKGETMPSIPMPENIPDKDDSYDFEFGLPEDDEGQEDVFQQEDTDNNFSDEEFENTDFEKTEDIEGNNDLDDSNLNILPDMDSMPDLGAINDLPPITDFNDLPFSEQNNTEEIPSTDTEFEDDALNTFSIPDLSDLPDLPDLHNPSDENFVSSIPSTDFSEDVFSSPVDDVSFPPPEMGDIDLPSDIDFNTEFASAEEGSVFDIPGFSDFDIAKTTTPQSSTGAHSKNNNRPKNTLTDTEYTQFLNNLKGYPLNLRVAIEEVIVKNEFQDEAVMELVMKVVKKAPARQVSSHMERSLGITVDVPLNYERRTVDQYEAYKSSLEYQLKNRIIPATIAGVAIFAVGIVLFFLGNRFIYKPLKAESLYKQGYTLVENNLYSQGELKFDEALTYRASKKWFFSYARTYRAHKQYDRASSMYERLLQQFNNNLKAGLEYATMVLEDLYNYERAEYITRRYILDNHINDKSGLLLLGDIFLEWGTQSKDEGIKAEKFEQARLQYAVLMQLYGSDDLYMSRMLRYFMRTDNLREVLLLKSHFTNKKRMNLDAPDLVELGGYLLNKLYGTLPPSDEYLRSYIEDLRSLLEQAIEEAPDYPEPYYNLARYFVEANTRNSAKTLLETAIQKFTDVSRKSHTRILNQVDCYRMLGEIYAEEREYILAENNYASGIQLFEKEGETSGLTSNDKIGKLYADMGDIDYFISGDMDYALKNYSLAIANQYDVPSVRYRVGYVQYSKGNYTEALGSFIKTASEKTKDHNVLLALGNVLALRSDNFAAQGYYERLMTILDNERARYGVLFPQIREDQGEIVDLYMKTANNLGVQAQSMVYFSESIRAWDALTRNQTTMVRLEGSNLAAQNTKYLAYPHSEYDPAIYTDIPRVLNGEVPLEQ